MTIRIVRSIMNAGVGEPARTAVESEIKDTQERRRKDGKPLEMRPDEVTGKLCEDDEIEAWLIFRARARVGWHKTARSAAEKANETTHDTEGAQDGGADETAGEGQVRRARRTAKCLGSWEYERWSTAEGRWKWTDATDMPADTNQGELETARAERELPCSLHRRLQMDARKRAKAGDTATEGGVGRWQTALTGRPGDTHRDYQNDGETHRRVQRTPGRDRLPGGMERQRCAKSSRLRWGGEGRRRRRTRRRRK